MLLAGILIPQVVAERSPHAPLPHVAASLSQISAPSSVDAVMASDGLFQVEPVQ
jgi:hypothetical protein